VQYIRDYSRVALLLVFCAICVSKLVLKKGKEGKISKLGGTQFLRGAGRVPVPTAALAPGCRPASNLFVSFLRSLLAQTVSRSSISEPSRRTGSTMLKNAWSILSGSNPTTRLGVTSWRKFACAKKRAPEAERFSQSFYGLVQ